MQTDVFKRNASVRIPTKVDPWPYASIAIERMKPVLDRLDTEVNTRVYAQAVDNSEFNRDSLPGIRETLREHDLAPTRIVCWYKLGQNPVMPYLTVIVGAYFETWVAGEKKVKIDVEGADKLTVDGVAAEAKRVISKIEDLIASDSGASEAAKLPTARESSTADDAQSLIGTDDQGFVAWVKRHRSSVIIGLGTSIVGGIVVLLILG